MQRFTVKHERRRQRHLILLQLKGKLMFFFDLFTAPALGTIEFHYVTTPFLIRELIDAIFVAVERRQAGIDAQAGVPKRINNGVRIKGLKIKGSGIHRASLLSVRIG